MKTISPKEQFYCQYVGQMARHRTQPGVKKQLVFDAGQNDDMISIATAIYLDWPIQLRTPAQATDEEAALIGECAFPMFTGNRKSQMSLAREIELHGSFGAKAFRACTISGILVRVPVLDFDGKIKYINPGEAIAAGWCEVKLDAMQSPVNEIEYSNDEYLDLHGHDDVNFPRLDEKISSRKYHQLPEKTRRLYTRFSGANEVYYILTPKL